MPPTSEATKMVANGRLKGYTDEMIARDVVQLARTDLLNTLIAYAPDHALQWIREMAKALYVVDERREER